MYISAFLKFYQKSQENIQIIGIYKDSANRRVHTTAYDDKTIYSKHLLTGGKTGEESFLFFLPSVLSRYCGLYP